MNTLPCWTALLIGILLLIARSAMANESKSAAEAIKRGDVLREEGDFDGAIAAYTEAIRLFPNDANAYAQRARTHAMRKDFGKAISDYTNAIRLDPNNDYLYRNQAGIYEMQGDFDKAIANWNDVIRLSRHDTAYDFSYDYFLARAWLYSKKGDLDKAITDYTEALRHEHYDILVYCCRAEAYERKGALEKAIADYSEAVQLRPDNAYPSIGRACLYIEKGELDKAIADCTESIRLKPDFAAAYNYRGSAFLRKGDIGKAIADATEAIRLDPTKAVFFETRSSAYAKKGDKRRASDDRSAVLRLANKNRGNGSEEVPFQIMKNSEGDFMFADHRCSKYVPAVNYRNLSASFSDAQLKEMAKTSLDRTLFLRYIEAKWPVSRLKTHCTKANRFPEMAQNLVGNTCLSLSVHKDDHNGFDKIFVYACDDSGKSTSYCGSLMSDWRRWDYSLNIVRGKDYWVIIETLPNDFMDNPAKYLPGRAVQKKRETGNRP